MQSLVCGRGSEHAVAVRLGVWLLVVGVGCVEPVTLSPSAPALERCTPQLSSTPSLQLVLVTGRRVTVPFEITGLLRCASKQWELESVTVEVLDDDNQPIAHDDWLSIQPQSPRPPVFARHLEVTFVPPATKAVHLRLVVEPNIGAIVHTLPVYQPTPRAWVEEPGRICDGLLPREGGAALCVRSGTIEVRSPNGLEQRVVVGAATTTSMLWLFGPSWTTEGWRFLGDVATRVSIERTAVPNSLATRGSRLVSASDDGVRVFDEDGGVTWLRQPGYGPPAVLAATFIDGDTLLVARQGHLVRVPIVAGLLSLPAPEGDAQAASVSDDGIWRGQVGSRLFELHRVDGGHAEVQLPASAVIAWPRGVPDLVPIVRVGRVGPSSELIAVPFSSPDGGMALDFIELPEGVFPQWANSRQLFVNHPDGTLLMTSRTP